MLFSHEPIPPQRKNQQGITLLVALVLTVLLVLIGVTVVEKSKTGTELSSSNVRHNIVFEAAEQSLRNTIVFMQNIRHGEPIASDNGAAGRDIAANFKLNTIAGKAYAIVTNPAYSFVWLPSSLEKKACPPTGSLTTNSCPAGIDFAARIDDAIWNDYAIKSEPPYGTSIDSGNYILNTKTYTFIQLLKKGSASGSLGIDGNLSSTKSTGNYYLITVKASGYPPNTTVDNENARENVIIQSVYSSKY